MGARAAQGLWRCGVGGERGGGTFAETSYFWRHWTGSAVCRQSHITLIGLVVGE